MNDNVVKYDTLFENEIIIVKEKKNNYEIKQRK